MGPTYILKLCWGQVRFKLEASSPSLLSPRETALALLIMNRADVSKGLRRPDGVGNTKRLFCLPHVKLDLEDADLSEGQECGSFARGCWALCIFYRCWCPLHSFPGLLTPPSILECLGIVQKTKQNTGA